MAVCGKGGDLAYLVSNANRMPKAIKTAPMPRLSHGTNRGVCRNLTVNLSPSNNQAWVDPHFASTMTAAPPWMRRHFPIKSADVLPCFFRKIDLTFRRFAQGALALAGDFHRPHIQRGAGVFHIRKNHFSPRFQVIG